MAMSKINTNHKKFELDLELMENTDFEEIVICSKCKGYGSYSASNGTSINNISQEDTCSHCNGTGKLIKQVTVKFKSFDSKLAIKTQILRNPENLI